MADAESLRQAVQTRAPFSTWLGVVLLFVLFGVIVLAVIGPAPRGDTYEQKRSKAREEKLKAARDEETKTLTSYGWIDKNKGVARIPITRAMELTVAELAKKKPTPAGPIATPEAQASAATVGAAAPTPAPSASPVPSGTPKATSVAGPSSESRGQPAAAVNPPPAPPKTQPGVSATPAASPGAAAQAPVSASPAPNPSPAGSSSPVPEKTP
jgi:hypothetical protein